MTAQASFLDLIDACDNISDAVAEDSSLYRIILPNDSRTHGLMLASIVQKMPWTSDFVIEHGDPRTVKVLDRSEGRDTSASVTKAFKDVVTRAIDEDTFKVLAKRHSELFSVPGARVPVGIERFAVPLFGTLSRGAHMTAYTRTSSGIKIWVPRRSEDSFTYPGMLDSTVAGGVRGNESPFECIVHEAYEEASLSEGLTREFAIPSGVITYMGTSDPGSGGELELICPGMLYVFDLDLSPYNILTPRDHEVKEFYLWDAEKIKQAMLCSEFKPNCNLVMIDFMIRHGLITADNEKDFVEIATRLHRKLPIPMAP